MDFFKNLDKAFDIEKVLENVSSGIDAVDEFPERNKASKKVADVPVTNLSVSRARQAHAAWEAVDLEVRKPEWEQICQQIQSFQGNESNHPTTWEQRARDAEYHLVKVCSLLIGAPDPLPYLDSVANLTSRIIEVEIQNKQLSSAAANASADAQEVQQLVEDHRKLQGEHGELKAQLMNLESELGTAKATATATESIQAALDSRDAEVLHLSGILKAVREEYEKAQSALFEALAVKDQEVSGRQREMDMLLDELERANQRVTELELDKAHFLQRQQQLKEGDLAQEVHGAPFNTKDSFWEHQVRQHSETISSLQQQLETATQVAADVQGRRQLEVQQAANRSAALELQVEQLKGELSRRPEVKYHQEVVQRMEALQMLVDVQLEMEGWTKEHRSAALQGLTMQSTHNVMQERNRKLSSDVSTLKRELSDKQEEATRAQEELKLALDEISRLSGFVKQLEDDLTRSSGVKNSGPAATQLLPGSTSLDMIPPQMPGTPDPGREPGHELPAGGGAAEGSSLDADAGGLLEIVVSQRDRFRQRVMALEVEKGQLMDEVSKTKKQLEDCRADNVTLYEKVRYLERYSQQSASTAVAGGGRAVVLKVDSNGVRQPEASDAKSNRYQCGPLAFEFGTAESTASHHAIDGSSVVGGGAAGGGLSGGVRSRATAGGSKGRSRLAACFPADDAGDEEAGSSSSSSSEVKQARAAYEARVNPFVEFQKTEVESRVRGLQLHDRAVLAGGKLLLGSRFARAFLATYAVLLHLFIMVLMYYAMSPRSHVVEMVDMDMVKQQTTAGAGVLSETLVPSTAIEVSAAGGTVAGKAFRSLMTLSSWHLRGFAQNSHTQP
ncbi:hypothetical protein CEUSTIGMA_g2721.t1 [Chlamydomonas eustigma]|uniref:CASP C-terminal domain-containing protein n=1 Tax=Chlamydomonas eustigma TaxID=1157962 RepID=A0A250WWX5_9CHLO|nr:hypothetical protein CEUSTIGMA_g2721.t1 [Chlamydomonas eustigma]|eukprot:GAX75276.1 hypothetical protein CEUSTIGMA_g2721.t1 [Chlamydomonas eustigma]